MFNSYHYVPMLKAKQGEYGALAELAGDIKKHITPLLEIPPVPWDYQNEKPSKSIDEHLVGIPAKIEKSWGTEQPLFLDLYYIEPGDQMSDGSHPLNWLMEQISAQGIKAIPVTSLDRDADFQNAVGMANHRDTLGVCIRITCDDIDDLTTTGRGLEELISQWDTAPENCDIIIDLQEIPIEGIHDLVEYACNAIQTFPHIEKWRTLTLAASSFPLNLSGIARDDTKLIMREELSLWNEIRAVSDKLPRIPTFGDYGITHPTLPDLDPRTMRMSVNLRYTTETAWLIAKGRDARRYGYDQFNNLCRNIISLPEYKGPDFSWGDAYIKRCAEDEDGPGNASSWRKAGTNHHITLVVGQVANPTAI
ncbi:MAG TPA: hypothetical protein ENI98_05885 [Gammaproteobacteria bacterium]|nr:hypothetical protein [Gammaproteobacteria bacterium]